MKTAPKKPLILLFSFLLPAGLMAAVFALCGICPFGDRSLGVMDMAHQYLSFLSSLRNILAGDASALYLPSMALGGNMVGVAAYYLMSPLNLITCLFPREALYSAVSLLYFLRVGLCGLTMAVYCGERHGYSRRLLLPALAYGFMAYMLANAFNYLWQDCVILLPLVALGLARLIQGRGSWLYIVSLAGALFINFYLGYILCLFSVLFFLYELLSAVRRGAFPWRRVLDFALGSLAAGALAAVILVPAFLSLAGGKASFSLEDLTLAAKFPFIELFSKLLPGAFNYDEIMPVGMPNIFCGSVTVSLAVLYFANSAVPRRRRILTGCLLGTLALSFWVSALDLIWHGMNVPSWYNYRYSFLFSFLLIAAADRALSLLRDGSRPWHLLLPAAVAAALSAAVFAGRTYSYVTWPSALAAVVIAGATGAGLYIALRPGTAPRLISCLAAVLLLVHMAELGINAKISLTDLTGQSSSPSKWAEYVSAKSAAFDLIDTGGLLVRAESPTAFDMNRCEPMLFGYDGISHYGSTISQKNLDFLDALGLDRYTDLYALYGAGVTAGADSFLGVRYLVDTQLRKPYTMIASTGTYAVYENPYALPIAFTVAPAFAADGEISTAASCFDNIQALYDAAAPEVGAAIYTAPEVTDVTTADLVGSGGGRYSLAEGAAFGSVTYTLTVRTDGPLYGVVETADFPGLMIFVNEQFSAYYATAQTNGTLYLGDYAAGDTVTFQIRAFTDMTLENVFFATEDQSALAQYRDAIVPGGCSLTKLSADHYTGSFTTGEGDTLLALTIPYDPSWHITLDGQAVEALEVQNCLMALPVAAGTHTLEMRYIPAGLIPGGCVTVLAGAVCLAVCIRRRRKCSAQYRGKL